MVDTLKIKGLMAENGLAHYEVAKMMNVSDTTLRAKVNNKKAFTTDEIIRLAEVLKIPEKNITALFFYPLSCETITIKEVV